MSDEKLEYIPKVTFLAKEPTVCPVCEHKFFKESLMSGGGRLSAGEVTETLHRVYKPVKKYGKINPIVYSVNICPSCFYSTLGPDFTLLPEDKIDEVRAKAQDRINFVNKLIGIPVDFTYHRTLESGAAAYALAIESYDYMTRKSFPIIKQAMCSMRTAFLMEDLDAEKPDNYFKYIAELYYRKAIFFYKRAIELNQSKEQVMENLKSFGPDIDKNYGYDGIIYLIGVLTFKYGIKDDKEVRKKELEEARQYLGKLFGMGKADFDKPKEILEKSKDFHSEISKELKELDESS